MSPPSIFSIIIGRLWYQKELTFDSVHSHSSQKKSGDGIIHV